MWVAEELVKRNISKTAVSKVDELSRISWVKESWVPLQGKQSRIPEELNQILKVAKEFNIEIQARKCNMELKGKMVICHHVMKPKENYEWNKKASICLRLSHGIGIMCELKDFVDNGVETA